ncbi:MAG: thioredoxin-dependent peroxiredoxin [Abditibacteriota bacterium]|nr:thioredoxin-dependent peroxiredoxin [Abditibacteriota bacterium]
MSSHPILNQPFPDFSLPVALPTGEQSTLSRDQLQGQPFVLFVYPKDATSGCTIEVCGFRDLYSEFEKSGVVILGLSRDGVRSHGRFIQNQSLPYSLLADADQSTLKAWQLIKQATMYGKPVTKVQRTTYLVDGNSVLRHIWESVTPLGHAAEVLEACRIL